MNQIRLTAMNAGDKFVYNGTTYKKVHNREKSGHCENVKSGEIITLPVMLFVEKFTEEESVKKVRRKPVYDSSHNSGVLNDSGGEIPTPPSEPNPVTNEDNKNDQNDSKPII